MKIDYKYGNSAFVIWLLAVSILNLIGSITFGHGLGDLYYLACLIILSIILFSYYHGVLRKRTSMNWGIFIYIGIVSAVTIFSVLKLTIWRGPEFPWNGRLFLE